jgi:hypothetical protein
MAHLAYLWRITANREDVLIYPLTACVAHFWLVSVKTGVVLSDPFPQVQEHLFALILKSNDLFYRTANTEYQLEAKRSLIPFNFPDQSSPILSPQNQERQALLRSLPFY